MALLIHRSGKEWNGVGLLVELVKSNYEREKPGTSWDLKSLQEHAVMMLIFKPMKPCAYTWWHPSFAAKIRHVR
ncbi:hypothetical protein Hte_004583 [Hypoxylon texense]